MLRKTTLFISVLTYMLVGCATRPIPLSGQEIKGGLCISDPEVAQRLQSLKVGMCENEVFEILGITHDTPNLSNLDSATVYQHVSRLEHRPNLSSACETTHDTEVPLVGHGVPCKQLKRSGYVEGLKWVQRTTGEDSCLELILQRGAFLSYAECGVKNRDSKDSAYLWESIFGDPFSGINDSVLP